jgi:hypothetical protein
VHEARAAEIVRALWPNRYVTAGHAVVAEYREYERGTTAAVNAAIQPVLHRYIERLQSELARRGFARDLLVMQGNGGTVSSRIVAEHAVATVMSGPASGVIAAAATALQAGRTPGEFGNVVTYDMGGTSSDVALVLGGQPTISSDLELEYAMPIHVPMIDVHTIGAGGGSIASVDASGMLKVGPESAGATPGPICYGRGGTRPTITDANLALGRLDPDALLAVEHAVSLEQVRAALLEQVGKPLGLDAIAAAAAILRIANDRMAGAIRMVSLSRGHDPRDFAALRVRRRRPAARGRARARARHPARPDPGAAGADERPRLPRRRPAPRFRRDRQPAARGRSRRAASPRSLPSRWRAARRSWRARTSRSSASSACTAPTCSSRARATSCRCRSTRRRSRSSRCARSSPPPTTGASASSCRDTAGARQPAHGRHRPAQARRAAQHRAVGAEGDPRRGATAPCDRCGSRSAAGTTHPVYVREHLPADAPLRRPGDRRAARLHDRHRARATGSRSIRSAI